MGGVTGIPPCSCDEDDDDGDNELTEKKKKSFTVNFAVTAFINILSFCTGRKYIIFFVMETRQILAK